MQPRTVFMGSPEFALPTLRALAAHYPLVGVITQPDRPAGRGNLLTPPPVKLLAQELGVAVIQPRRLREPEAMAQLREWAPELIVVAAFGQILKPEVLDLPRYGCINVHASLLPRWRGAAPIQAAILNGDAQTGITIMIMDPGVDTGPTLAQQAMPILADDTARTLSERLALTGGELLIATLAGYLSAELRPQPQDGSTATYAPMLKKEDGLLDFSRPAGQLANRVRAFDPWPGAYMLWQGQMLKILHAHTAETILTLDPGTALVEQRLPAVVTGAGLLVLDEVQPAGKKPMPGKVFLQGARGWGN
jgi:methionyl-tRNA formyltransferase